MCDGLDAFAPRLQVADRDVAAQGVLDRLKRGPIRLLTCGSGCAGVMCIADAVCGQGGRVPSRLAQICAHP